MKGQITVFILLGMIVLVLIAVSAFFFTKSEQAVKQKPNTDMVTNFVQSCLQIAGLESLTLLSSQGVIERRQGGVQPDMDDRTSVIVGGQRIANYVLLQPEFRIPGPPDITNAPIVVEPGVYDDYPWKTFPYLDDTLTTKEYSVLSAFGWANVPPANASFKGSIEESLETYTEKRMKTCNVAALKEQAGIRVEPRQEPNVDVRFTATGTDLFLHWPLLITDSSGTRDIENFVQHFNVRLKRMLDHINLLIDAETTDLQFHISEQGGVHVTSFPTGSVVTVRDAQSSIAGKPYNISFGIPNRAPVLLYLDQRIIDDPFRACENTRLRAVQGKIALTGGSGNCSVNKQIRVEAMDADEWQPVTIQYTMLNFGGNDEGQTSTTLNYPLSSQDVDPTNPCIHLKVEATDGTRTDGQILTLYNDDRANCPV